MVIKNIINCYLLAKLPTGKLCKPISAPEKPFFKPGRAKITIFGSRRHYF
jgi:hypothetical protein